VTKEKAIELGTVLGTQKNIIIITGAGHGLPYTVAFQAAKKGIEIWGYPPVTDIEHQRKYTPECDLSIYAKTIFIPKTFPLKKSLNMCRVYRNFQSTKASDAGIIIAGRWGSLNEFTNLYEMGKVIGVLKGTGGVADEVPKLLQKIK